MLVNASIATQLMRVFHGREGTGRTLRLLEHDDAFCVEETTIDQNPSRILIFEVVVRAHVTGRNPIGRRLFWTLVDMTDREFAHRLENKNTVFDPDIRLASYTLNDLGHEKLPLEVRRKV